MKKEERQEKTAIDVASIVFGVFMLILTVSLFAVMGLIVKTSRSVGTIQLGNFGVASLNLLTCVLALSSGATGHRALYIIVILISILAVLDAVFFSGVAAIGFVAEALVQGPDWGYFTISLPIPSIFDSVISQQLYFGTGDGRLPYGVLVINIISIVILIIISCLSCCGTCCNSTARIPAANRSVGPPPGPPSYVSSPPKPTQLPTHPYPPSQPRVSNVGLYSGPQDGVLLGKMAPGQ